MRVRGLSSCSHRDVGRCWQVVCPVWAVVSHAWAALVVPPPRARGGRICSPLLIRMLHCVVGGPARAGGCGPRESPRPRFSRCVSDGGGGHVLGLRGS